MSVIEVRKSKDIIRGEKFVMDIFLTDENEIPFDLTNFDTFKACLLTEDGSTYLEVTETVNANGSSIVKNSSRSDEVGNLVLTLGGADTATLRTNNDIDLEVKIDNVATPNPKKLLFKNALNVISSNCP